MSQLNLNLDVNKIKQEINQYSSHKLADMIVSHRYLRVSEEACIIAMEELNNRRESGDTFDFETYITEQLSSLPKFNFSIPNFGELLSTLKGKK